MKDVSKSEAANYLKKSQEFLEEAREALLNQRFNAAAFNAIQSIINANDAFTISLLGKRASKDHQEAMRTHIEAIRIINDTHHKQTLKDALDSRSDIGYTGKLVKQPSAENLIKKAVRFLEWCKTYVK